MGTSEFQIPLTLAWMASERHQREKEQKDGFALLSLRLGGLAATKNSIGEVLKMKTEHFHNHKISSNTVILLELQTNYLEGY